MSTRLELAAVVKSFGSHRVLDRAWLNVRAGESVGLIGANGAGKTTLLRIAAGLVLPDEGLARCLKNGRDPVVCYFGAGSASCRAEAVSCSGSASHCHRLATSSCSTSRGKDWIRTAARGSRRRFGAGKPVARRC